MIALVMTFLSGKKPAIEWSVAVSLTPIGDVCTTYLLQHHPLHNKSGDYWETWLIDVTGDMN